MLSVISFTENGMHLSETIARQMKQQEIALFTKCSHAKDLVKGSDILYVEQSIRDWAREQVKEKNSLLFIGACGIAVRAIAPCITDKLHDRPVLVMDEKGKYVIPILAGHVGGANELALHLSEMTGAIPVITTATDLNEKFAVDIFARRNGLHIVNKEGIAKVSSKVLAGKEITLSIESGHVKSDVKLPEDIRLVSYPPMGSVDVVITSESKDFDALLYLKPREYVIGMGCKKGKEAEKISEFIDKSIREAGFARRDICALASIDRKKEEQGFLIWSRKENVPFVTFSAEQLQEVEGEFHTSAFVKAQVGVNNVCERAALTGCGKNGRLIYGKHAEDGMPLAIAKRDWRVSFDEE